MKIRWRLANVNKGSLKTPTDVVSTNTPGSAVSSITTPSSGASLSSKCVNLEHVLSSRINAGVSVSLQPCLVCLIVFGGENDKTDFEITESIFDVDFRKNSV